MNDTPFLNWIGDRLVNVYKESPNVDFVLRLRKIANSLAEKDKRIKKLEFEVARREKIMEQQEADVDRLDKRIAELEAEIARLR